MTQPDIASEGVATLETAPRVTSKATESASPITPDPEHTILRAIRQPALVVSGSHDTILPANNAYTMFKELSNAQLVLYPDSGHGALFQHHEMFVSHVRTFLDARPAAA